MAQRGSQCCPHSPARAGLGTVARGSQRPGPCGAKVGAQGMRGRHRGRGCRGKGLGQRKAGGCNSSPALQTPASPCTLTHTHTHMHTTPPGQSRPGGTGYIQHSPSVGANGSGQDQGHIQTRSPSSPTPLERQEQAGAGGAGTGTGRGEAGGTQGEVRGGRVPAQVYTGELEGADADEGVNGNAPGWEVMPTQERRTAGGESHFGESGECRRPHIHPSVVPARPCHPRPQRR